LDKQLIILAKAGDENALTVLFKEAWREVSKLQWFYRSIVIEDVEDVFQEVMLLFIKNPLSVNATTDKQFLGWVIKSCKNKILDILNSQDFKRKRSLFVTNNEGEEAELGLEDSENVEKEIITRELYEQINFAINKLNPVDQVIICDHLKGYSLLEIARKVDLTYDNVRQRKSRAVSRLRTILKGKIKLD